jgi:serine/threonine protein kinase
MHHTYLDTILCRFAEFRREALLMSGLEHNNLVELTGMCIEQSQMLMVTEYLKFGDLYGFLHSRGSIDWNLRLKIAMDIAQGMNHLHTTTPAIIHRDLKVSTNQSRSLYLDNSTDGLCVHHRHRTFCLLPMIILHQLLQRWRISVSVQQWSVR